jgi:TetR/AcrR family transcriptional regulator, ethionamide resistance regulator
MSSRPAVTPRSARGRRVPRPSGDDRELAILATAEALLAERPFGEVSIDDLARGAGISRPTFYFYFPSKDAVLLTLLDRVTVEAEAELAAAGLPEGLPTDPVAHWRAGIAAFYETFRRHRPVALACAEVRATNAEVRRLWETVTEGWVRLTAEAIEAERARGAAPPGLPARDLAAVLCSMNERAMYATFGGSGPAVAEADVVDVLLDVWLKAIYGEVPEPPASGGPVPAG